MHPKAGNLMDDLARTLAAVEQLGAALEAENAVYHQKSGTVELTFRAAEHQLPAAYMGLHRKLAAVAGPNVCIRVAQGNYLPELLKDPEKLTRCIRDCCTLSAPMLTPFLRASSVDAREEGLVRLTFADPEAVRLARGLRVADQIAGYFRDAYDCRVHVEFGQGEVKEEVYTPPVPEKIPERPAPGTAVSAPRAAKAERQLPPPQHIGDLQPDPERRVSVDACVAAHEVAEKKDGELRIHKLALCDGTGSVTGVYLESARTRRRLALPGAGTWIRLSGIYEDDKYEREPVLRIRDVGPSSHQDRQDNAPVKRVELHAHTKMSAMDAVTEIGALVKRAAKWGHPAVAITDHGVGQAFPIAAGIAAKAGIKIIYGVEGYLFDDEIRIFEDAGEEMPRRIVVTDIRTTGPSPLGSVPFEISAVSLEDGEVKDRFQTFIATDAPIDAQLLGEAATEEQIRSAPAPREAAEKLLAFIGTSPVAGTGGRITLRYLQAALGLSFAGGTVDIETALRTAFPALPSYKLKSAAKALGIRAGETAVMAAAALARALAALEERGACTPEKCNAHVTAEILCRGSRTYHIILLCRSKAGMTDLNRLISESHITYLDGSRKRMKPKMPRSLIRKLRTHLLVGSACESGELYQAMVEGAPEEELRRIASFYDYLEVQPLGNNQFMVREGIVPEMESIRDLNRRIIALGEELEKPVAATCDVHFLEPEDECYRRLMQHCMGYGAAPQPPLYLRTTEEMLEEFSYLPPEKAREIVVEVPRLLAQKIESFPLLPSETLMPVIENASERLEEMAYETARRIYGDPLPEIVRSRLARELDSIIRHGFSVLYYSAHLLVKKSNEDGYLVGSRGSVGSSLAATMTGITEVNPLPPHYVCPACQYSDFDTDRTKYDVGPDLPEAACPRCGTPLRREGFNIPFEVFLGIDADKVPDIDLNFSGEYQSRAHAYTEEIFGKGHVFRAGTILSLKDKNAMGYVRKYAEETGLNLCGAERTRLAHGLEGVRKSSGKHPGGMVIVPKDHEVYEFTAVQWPANQPEDGFVTTHYGFDSMHDILVKLDILGHDGPTIMKLMQDITGRDPLEIPLSDPGVLRLFSSIAPLGIEPEALFDIDIGTLGIPEFGTPFVRGMLRETKPSTVAEIVRISGLSHGTDVWLDNAQTLIQQGVCSLSEAICARDDIMNYLVAKGVDKRIAFFIMEATRKGKVAKFGFEEDQERALREAQIPSWFIQACRKIKYMFPKGHAVAYTLLSLRIAYCKLYEKAAFYATFFDVHLDDFSAEFAEGGLAGMRRRRNEIKAKGNDAQDTEKRAAYLLEVACEMYLRGLQFLPVDLQKSDPVRFTVEDGGLRMPFMSIPGLGEKVAREIVSEREKGKFLSVQDLEKRARVSSSITAAMKRMGMLNGMPESNQLSIFDF